MMNPRALAEDSLIEEEFLVELRANGMSERTLGNYRNAVKTLEILEKDPAVDKGFNPLSSSEG